MVTQAPKKSATAIAIAFSLSCVGLIIFVWVAFSGSVPMAAQGYRVKALFNETGLLVPKADVRISGVNVGKVVTVQAQGRQSLVTMEIYQQFAPIPRDTHAILREKTLLGEAYVDLATGTGKGGAGGASGRHVPKLPDGGTIPQAQIEPTQQLDQVLNDFTPPVQQNFQQFLIGTGAGLRGRGQDLNDSLGNFGPAATELQQVADVLNGQSGSLRSLISSSSTVLNALGQRGADLDRLISSGNSVFSTTATEDRALTATVNALPAFLTQLRTTLVKLNGTLAVAKPSLDALKPVTPLLRPALVDLTNLSGPLVSLLKAAPPVLRDAIKDVPSITTFVNELGPLSKTILPAAQQIVPMINVVSDYKEQLVNGMANLSAILLPTSSANTTSDALGYPAGMANMVRALITLGPDSIWGQTKRSAAQRSNAYYAPGTLAGIANGGETAASCAGAGGNQNVPCKLQPSYDWGHGIGKSYYPRVTAAPTP